MNRIPSPSDAREDVRPETRASAIPSGMLDDGRQRQRIGADAINPYSAVDDIKHMLAPTNGKGTPEQVAREIDIEWKAYETYGKPNWTEFRGHQEQGWRPVQMSDFPGRFAPEGTEGPVRVNDMILMHRPMRLTVQAREEDIAKATRLMQVNRQKMAEAPDGQAPRMAPTVRSSVEAIEIPE